MKRTVLITGAAGYIGSVVVSFLLRQKYHVLAIDKLSFGAESLLNFWYHPHFKFIKMDLTNPDGLDKIWGEHKIEAIVHLAAIVGDPACAKYPEIAKKTNYDASIDLLEKALEHKIEKFIFASTCSNYGKMADPNGYVDENSILAPVSLYAELKVKFEKILLGAVNPRAPFSPTVLRFSTVYGISPRMRFDLTVNEFTKELALKRKLEVFGEKFWRPYCHVYDFARAIQIVLDSEPEMVANNVFNVGDTDENYQKQMIVDEITKIIPDADVRYVHRNEDPRDYRVSFEKIKRELNFNITRRVPDGIREIFELINKNGLLNPDDPKYRNI